MKIFNQSVTQIGLDIGTTGVRMVELEFSKNETKLLCNASQTISTNVSESQTVEDHQELIATIKKLITDSGATSRSAVISLPLSKTTSTLLKTSKKSDEELKPLVKKQVEHFTSMPINQLAYDWITTDDSMPDNQIEILTVACPISLAQKYTGLASKAGLKVIAVEPGGISIARNLASVTKLGKVIVHLGAYSTDIVIVYKNTPRIMRSIPVGGETIVNELTNEATIELGQARQLIASFGLSPGKLEGQLQRIIKASIDKIIDEVKNTKLVFLNRYKDAVIEQIVVSGGSSQIPGLPSYIANQISLPVEIGNSWVGISYDVARQDKLLQESASYCVAAGLAQRSVRF